MKKETGYGYQEYKRQFPETMTQSEFGTLMANYWYTNYNGELMIAEARPMRDYVIRHGNWTNYEDYLASLSEDERDDPWAFTAWCETYPDEDDPMSGLKKNSKDTRDMENCEIANSC